MNYTTFNRKVRISGTLTFDTAFHIGSGKEGDLATDMGVIKDEQGWPVLPGSSLKGKFRATVERLAGYLNLSACLLDTHLSGVTCVGDQEYFKANNEEFKKLKTEKDKLTWLETHSCDVCKLFGSPMMASRIFFSDGKLQAWPGSYQVRDGVVIDRDSGTARHGLKYDFEVAARSTSFSIMIELENPNQNDLALVAAGVAEWEAGFRLGGFTSRGLGVTTLTETKIEQVDYTKIHELKQYLLTRKMQPASDLLEQALTGALTEKGEPSC